MTLLAVSWAVLVGLAIGSFLNVVICRIPLGFRLTLPSRSACRTCRRRLTWSENIPLVSYFAQKGRCRGCGHSISPRYPLVELMTALLFVAIEMRFGLSLATVYYCVFAGVLLAVTFIDLDHRIIPDAISFPFIAVGVVFAVFVPQQGLRMSVYGAGIGGLGLWFTAWAYERATGREGLGFGDVKLIALIGAFLGPLGALGTILTSSIYGSVIGLTVMAVRRQGLRTAMPYGPFLAMGAFTWLFWGDRIVGHFLFPT